MKTRWLMLITILSSCTGESRVPETAAPGGLSYVERHAGKQASVQVSAAALPDVYQSATKGQPDLAAVPRPDATSMIIRTATALIEVDSLETAIAELKRLAARVGGYVANTGIEVGRKRLRQAVIEIKIPARHFDEVLSGLQPIGRLESVEVSAQDVGEEYVDVSARIDNASRLERRLIGLLATRTGKLKDVLDVEQELARVREAIERYQGRIRYLQAHTATSTLIVTAREPAPVVGEAGQNVMAEAFRQSWRNFVALLAIVVQSLGIIIPLGALAFVVWVVVKRVRRVETQRAA